MRTLTRILLVGPLLLGVLGTTFAAELVFQLHDGSELSLPLLDIQSVHNEDAGTQFLIQMTNGPDHTVSIAEIRKLTFRNLSSITEQEAELVKTFTLLRTYPNPFNHTATVEYSLPSPGQVEVMVYNIFGQQVRRLADEYQHAGLQRLTWDGRSDNGSSLASGAYICRVRSAQQQLVTRMIFIK